MGTKTISIMDDVHKLLIMNRMAGESFSDVLRRTLSKKRDIMEFAGAWKDIDDRVIEKMKKDIKDFRKNALKGTLRRIKDL